MLRGLFRSNGRPFIRPFFSAGLEYRQPHGLNLNMNTRTRTYAVTSPANALREKRRHHYAKSIRGFDPLHILPEDYADDIGLRGRFRFRVIQENERHADSPTTLHYHRRGRTPDGCRGFFYFYKDPQLQPQMSGLRFRICAKATQRSFNTGKDLLKYNSHTEPWTVPVAALALSGEDGIGFLLEKLFQDGLVDRLTVEAWLQRLEAAGLSRRSANYVNRGSKILASLEEPFKMDLATPAWHNVIFPAEARVARFHTSGLRKSKSGRSPYKGKCLVQFENIMDATGSSGRKAFSYNIRIIKNLTPVERTIPGYGGTIPPPKEGSLVLENGSPMRAKASLYAMDEPSSQLQLPPKRVPKASGRQFSTLDPDKIGSHDFVDISSRHYPVLYTSADVVIPGSRSSSNDADRTSAISSRMVLRFQTTNPPGTRGFLYWYRDPHLPEISAEVRFRVAPTASREGFSLGQDLMLFPGSNRPWSIPLLRLFIDKQQFGPLLVAQAVRDGLISQELADTCRRIVQSDWYSGLPKTTHVIHAYNQPFTLDLAGATRLVYILDHEGCVMRRMNARSIFGSGTSWKTPVFYGRCVLRLEPVVDELQASPGDGPLQFHIRVIKILEPIGFVDSDYQRTDLPQEGSLISRRGQPIVVEVVKVSKESP